MGYDLVGRLVAETNAAGVVTRYAHLRQFEALAP
jgi:hypothetical protein